MAGGPLEPTSACCNAGDQEVQIYIQRPCEADVAQMPTNIDVKIFGQACSGEKYECESVVLHAMEKWYYLSSL